MHAESELLAALPPGSPHATVLRTLGAAGLFAAGRAPGRFDDAVAVARWLAAHDGAVARVYVAQRSLVLLLDESPNVAVAEHHRPDVLDGHTAGSLGLHAVSGHDTGRGWRLQGAAGVLANTRPHESQLALPVDTGGGRIALVLLAGDADGLSFTPAGEAFTAEVHLDQVYYREDETLAVDGAALLAAVDGRLRALQAVLEKAA